MSPTRMASAVLLCSLLGLTGCLWSYGQFDPLHRGDAFDEAQKRFTRMIRWGQIEKAASYVAEDAREQFLADAPALQGVRFTDYEVLVIDLEDGLRTGTVEVLFYGYRMPVMVEKTVAMTQEWEHGDGNWRVRPTIEDLRGNFGSPDR